MENIKQTTQEAIRNQEYHNPKYSQYSLDLAIAERDREIVEMIESYREKILQIMPNGNVPFVVWQGKADEDEKRAIYFQGFTDIINLITNSKK